MAKERFHIVWMKWTEIDSEFPELKVSSFETERDMLEFMMGNAGLTGRSPFRVRLFNGKELPTVADAHERMMDMVREQEEKNVGKKEKVKV